MKLKAIKKPIEIEFVIWDGKKETFSYLAGEFSNYGRIFSRIGDGLLTMKTFKTRDSKAKAEIGDYVIKGLHGEMFLCNPDFLCDTNNRDGGDNEKLRYMDRRIYNSGI